MPKTNGFCNSHMCCWTDNKDAEGGGGGGNVRTCVDCVRGAEQVCASACDTMHYGIHGQPLCCNICVKTRTRSCALQVFFYLA